MKKTILRRACMAVFALCLLMTGASFPGGQAAAATNFSDVTPDYWGASYISFAAEKGIIKGYPHPDGGYYFAPESPVTREEAATMLYRALVAAGQAASKGTDEGEVVYQELFDSYKIAAWARPYVAFGLSSDIISESELSGFTDPASGIGIAAPRLQAGVWTAKALSSNFTGVYSLPYIDAASIPADALPYVDLLYRQRIMQGSLQADGTIAFLPAGGIKRVEFAAIAARVYEAAAAAKAGGFDLARETMSIQGVVSRVDVAGNRIFLREIDAAVDRMITIDSKSQIAYDGNLVYNGLDRIVPGQALLVSGMSTDAGKTAQVLLFSAPRAFSGKVVEVETLSAGLTKVGILDGEGNVIEYLQTPQTKAASRVMEGRTFTFIPDGVKLIEII